MRSLTGGVVYYGDKFPELDGAYVYGDWSTGRIWGVEARRHGKVTWHKELARTPLQITGFRATRDGDLLVIDHGGGIYKLRAHARQNTPATAFPTQAERDRPVRSSRGHIRPTRP